VVSRFLRFIVFLTATTALYSSTENAETGSRDGSTVVAEVDGAKITLAQFEQKHPAALFQARNTFYETQRKALDEYIDEYLLERQAQKENVTVTQLLEKHVNSTLGKDPSDDALRVYYEGIDTAEPFETMRIKIRDHLSERRVAKAKTAYMQALRSQAKVEFPLKPPRVLVSLDNTPVRGNVNAPLKLIEYSDYECPYCQQIQPDLDKIEAEYKGRLAFAYKDTPLPMHSHAQKAAEAAHCSGVQGKYWEYHDLLLSTKELEIPQLKAKARQLKLDTNAFDKCLDDGEQAALVKAQLAEAQTLGVQGTPSFFLNGHFYSGSLPIEKLRQAVEEELKKSTSTTQSAKR